MFQVLIDSPGNPVEIRFSLSLGSLGSRLTVPWHPEGRRLDRFPSQIFQATPLSITKSRWMTRCLFWDSEEDTKFRNENSQFWSHCSAHGQAPHLDWSDMPCDIGTDNYVSARDNFSHEAINYPNPCQPEHFFSMVTWLLEWCHTDIHSLDEFIRYKNYPHSSWFCW